MSDDAPCEMKGGEIPVTGMREIAVPTFTMLWNASVDATPVARSIPDASRARSARRPAKRSTKEEREEDEPAEEAHVLLGEPSKTTGRSSPSATAPWRCPAASERSANASDTHFPGRLCVQYSVQPAREALGRAVAMRLERCLPAPGGG